jgi:hypothetical protein
MVTTKIGKIQKGTSRQWPVIFPFYPLQPLLTPKNCNSVTLWKNGESSQIYWLQFLLQFLIEIKKNCNQLSPSSGYRFTNLCYIFSKKPFVTVTTLIYNTLIQLSNRLQNYIFLEPITGYQVAIHQFKSHTFIHL